jgi:NRPS condensation-like uncharacterized protein
MSEREFSFPQTVALNGIDNFLLQLDGIMLRSSGKRNICTFTVELETRLDCSDLEQQLSALPAYNWITSLRIRHQLPFALSRWAIDTSAKPAEITEHHITHLNDIPEALLSQPIDVKKQAPFNIALLQTTQRSVLIFSWHHALMDAHGGERFILYLGTQPDSKRPLWTLHNERHKSLFQRLRVAYRITKFIFEKSEPPLFSLVKNINTAGSLRYRLLRFSAQESQIIKQRAQQQGGSFLLSAFFLAVTACTVARIQQQRGPLHGDMLVPVPQDRRRKGADGPLLGNQVTFLFYRIPQAALTNVQQCTAELVRQMTALMRTGNPNDYLLTMDLYRRVPGSMYRYLVKAPTSGLMGSFFYSYTGDSLQDYQQLFKQPVHNAVHYPPNVHPPGITFVYAHFHGALQITIAYMEEIVANDEIEQLLADLRTYLLGTNDNSKTSHEL